MSGFIQPGKSFKFLDFYGNHENSLIFREDSIVPPDYVFVIQLAICFLLLFIFKPTTGRILTCIVWHIDR